MFGVLSDESLVKKARKGKADAWDSLIQRYEKRVYNFAFRMTGNREDARDLMQNVFLAVFRGLDGYRGDAAFSSWLFAIASFRATDFYRRRKPEAELENEDCLEAPNSGSQSPYGETLRGQRNQQLLTAMAQLPLEQRLVVELKFFQDLTFEEMSGQLGVSANTLKSRLYGALKKIKTMPEVSHVL